MRQIVFFWLLTIFTCQLGAVEDALETPDFQTELTKFYYEKGEYRLATLAFAAIESEVEDEVKLIEAKAWLKLDSLEVAINKFADLRWQTNDDSLRKQILDLIKLNIEEKEPLEQIKLLIDIFEQNETEQLDTDLLILLAENYEKIKLYSEANDIYQTLLNMEMEPDRDFYLMKISLNHIFKKDFTTALATLESVLQNADSSLLADALFYAYIAHYALEQFQAAEDKLLKLYHLFPNDPRKADILQQLADLAVKKEQYLLSWFWLEELYKISQRADKIIIIRQITDIKKRLISAENLPNQFQYLRPNILPELKDIAPADSIQIPHLPPQLPAARELSQ